jgi:hypothetical protein
MKQPGQNKDNNGSIKQPAAWQQNSLATTEPDGNNQQPDGTVWPSGTTNTASLATQQCNDTTTQQQRNSQAAWTMEQTKDWLWQHNNATEQRWNRSGFRQLMNNEQLTMEQQRMQQSKHNKPNNTTNQTTQQQNNRTIEQQQTDNNGTIEQ